MPRLHTLFIFLPLLALFFFGSACIAIAQEGETTGSISNQDQLIIGNCQEIEYDLSAAQAENQQLLQQVAELSESNKKLQRLNTEPQNTLPENSLSATVAQLENKIALTTNQLEQTSKKYSILIEEFEKRGEKIATLQNIAAKQDDKTRFLWFAAGAAVFFFGLLAGKTGGRQKKKFTY